VLVLFTNSKMNRCLSADLSIKLLAPDGLTLDYIPRPDTIAKIECVRPHLFCMRHTRQIVTTLGALRRDVLSAEALDGLADRHGVAARSGVSGKDSYQSMKPAGWC
jgi:hypothetical protein